MNRLGWLALVIKRKLLSVHPRAIRIRVFHALDKTELAARRWLDLPA